MKPPTKPRGRPTGPRRPCGWCGKLLTAVQDRTHFTNCPMRPAITSDEAEARGRELYERATKETK